MPAKKKVTVKKAPADRKPDAEYEYVRDNYDRLADEAAKVPVPVAEPKPIGLAAAIKKTKPTTVIPHLIVEARAGTGKTTTLIEGLKRVKGLESLLTPSPQQAAVWDSMQLSPRESTVCFVAFNKSIAQELESRVPEGCAAMTMHSMGLKAVTAAFGRVKVNGYRVQDIMQELMERDIREVRRTKPDLVQGVEKLVGLCKANLINNPTDEDLSMLAGAYDVELNGSQSEAFALIPRIMERCKNVVKDGCIDFSDMVWLSNVLDLPVQQYDLLLVDEAQDLNRCQQALARRAGRRLILCGDPKQAIYSFAGADSVSMSRMFDELDATEQGCDLLPLTVTRRCGKAIVREANKIVADFDAFETNSEGLISQSTMSTYQKLVNAGDMVLCRVNAPLVSQCFKFLRAGRKANIQGRDVGAGLISTVNKMKASDVADLCGKLSDWLHAETTKENSKRNPNESRLINLQDRYDCLICFTDEAKTVADVTAKIEAIFTDDRSGTVEIKLSSGHRAKGLESDRVWILQPKGAECPHSMARSKTAIEQEWNLRYVMITRARHELYYVNDDSK